MRRGFWDRLLLAAATVSSLMRGRWRWAGAAALVVAAGLGALLLPGRAGGDAAAAAGPRPILTATGPTPYDLYDARSPGGRPDGALFQTKPARQRALAGPHGRVPAERVLPTIRDHPAAFVPPAFGPAPLPAPIADRAFVPPLAQPGLVPSLYDPVAVPTFGPIASTTPTIPIEPGNPTQPVVPPATAVPEPSTWMTMVGGVGLLGAALRARRRRARGRASA